MKKRSKPKPRKAAAGKPMPAPPARGGRTTAARTPAARRRPEPAGHWLWTWPPPPPSLVPAPSLAEIAARPAGLWFASLAADRNPPARAKARPVAELRRTAAGTAATMPGDDPALLGLLMLPVVLLAGMIAASQSLRTTARIALPDLATLAQPHAERSRAAAIASVGTPAKTAAPTTAALDLRRLTLPDRAPPAAMPVGPSSLVVAIITPPLRYAPVAPVIAIQPWDGRPVSERAALAWQVPPALTAAASSTPLAANGADVAGHRLPPDPMTGAGAERICHAPPRTALIATATATAQPATPATPESREAFGLRIATAAKAQIADLTVYSARYRSIAYPGGDIPDLYGACSDLIVRAYRSVGIDLQRLVAEAHLGGGDRSIAHRRTETLRQLFTRAGASLPVTDFPEDYKPGDIVTYHRPFSRVSSSHIAIVSDVIGPNRRPMIVHNRGWGPQLEDALFVDHITGHYRYQGPGRPAEPLVIAEARPLAAAQGPGRVASRAKPAF